jgi:hypothetical protein
MAKRHSFKAQKQIAAQFYVLLQNLRIKASFMRRV